MEQKIGTVAFIQDDQLEIRDYLVRKKSAFLDDKYQKKEWIQKMNEETVVVKKVRDIGWNGELSSYDVLKVFIPIHLSEETAKRTLGYCEKLRATGEVRDIHLLNYRESSFGMDYDFYDYVQNQIKSGDEKEEQNQKREPISILNYYFKEKLGNLNDFEKEMFYHYRNFDLDHLLFSNDFNDYPLNNENTGVISIFSERTYASTCTKMKHDPEMDKHIEWQGFQIGDSDILTTIAKTNSIQIQICKSNLIVWTPEYEKLTDYQRRELENFSLHVEDILNQRGEDILFLFGIVSGMEIDDREGLNDFKRWISEESLKRSR